jgi:hypothetical protein
MTPTGWFLVYFGAVVLGVGFMLLCALRAAGRSDRRDGRSE